MAYLTLPVSLPLPLSPTSRVSDSGHSPIPRGGQFESMPQSQGIVLWE